MDLPSISWEGNASDYCQLRTLWQVFAIWYDVRYGYKVLKNHRKQSGLVDGMHNIQNDRHVNIIYQHLLALYALYVIPLVF